MSVREPREQLVLDLLDAEWDPSNSFGATPTITYGWYDDPPTRPYINVLQPQEDALGGGETGFDGMNTAQGKPTQTRAVVVPVHAFAVHDELDDASTSHPREYLTGSADRGTGAITGGVTGEVHRIVGENSVEPTNPKTGNQPVQSMSVRTSRPVPEPEERGVFHYVIELNQLYPTV